MLLSRVNKTMGKNVYDEIVGVAKKVIDFDQHSERYPPLIEVPATECYSAIPIMIKGVSQYVYLGKEIHVLIVSAVGSGGVPERWADIPTGVYV